jgi:outer membrane protein assembly factor BamB
MLRHLARVRAGVRTALVLLAALGLSACSQVRDYLGGEDNTEPPAELVPFESTLAVRIAWERDVGAGVDKQYLKLRPSVEGERVFAADNRGRVTAFGAASGEALWDSRTAVPISGGPGTGADLVMVGTSDGEVVALESSTGATIWRARVSSEVLSPPSVEDDVVVVRTIDGKLFGLRATDGGRLWVYDRSVPALSLRGTSTPVIADGIAVAGFDSGRLVALSVRDGTLLWETRVAVPSGRSELERLVDLDADPVIFRDTIYAVTFQGRVSAVDLRTGTVSWRRDMSSHAGVGVDARNVYVTDERSHVWALDRLSSASVWRQQKLQARAVTSPASFREYVVVGDLEGYVHWMRQEDGQFVARVKVDSAGIIAPPVATDEAVYVYGASGRLAALVIDNP